MTPKLRGFLLITGTALLVLVFAWIVTREQATAPTTNTQLPTSSAANGNGAETNVNTTTLVTYTDPELAFSFQRAAAFTVTRDVTGTGEERIVGLAVNDGKRGITITIMDTKNAGIVSEAFSPRDARTVTLNGVAATRAIGSSAKDGSRVDLLTFVRGSNSFILNGPADLVDAIGGTWRFE